MSGFHEAGRQGDERRGKHRTVQSTPVQERGHCLITKAEKSEQVKIKSIDDYHNLTTSIIANVTLMHGINKRRNFS